jgi:dihydrofolate reductase
VRKIVLQMMTTLNGRLDDPIAWLHSVSDDQYREIDRIYATYDTVLVGRTTYEEMAAYWPGVLADAAGNETNLVMARRMHAYRKLIFSRTGRQQPTEWNNVELIVVRSDDELASYLANLKAQPGKDIHLSGGASFAQSVITLGLVDEFHFFVYPVVSPGATWFGQLPEKRELTMLDAARYENGVVRLHYVPSAVESRARPATFSELLPR